MLLAGACLFNHWSVAQTNLLFYQADDFYNAPDFNPAFLTRQKNFTFNIFPLAGTAVHYNNREAVEKIRKILFTDKVDDGTKETFRSLVKKDLSYNQVESNLLRVGINTARGAFDFQIREKAYVLMRFGGDFSRFVMDTLGTQTLSLKKLQQFPTEAVHFREYSVGYATELVRNQLTFGIRGKLYYGKAFTSSNVSGYITEASGQFYAQSRGDLYFSIPATDNEANGEVSRVFVMNGKSIADYVFNTGNSGFGLDVGLVWRVNPTLTISGSVLDLGSIKWSKYLYRLNFDKGNYRIDDIYLDPTDNTLKKQTDEIDLVDNISALYDIEKADKAFVTRMPTSYIIAARYTPSAALSIGVVNRYIQEKNMGHNALQATVAYNHTRNLTLVSGLGVYHTSFKNIPLGVIYRWNYAQFWAGTDNFLSFVVPKFSDYTSLTIGVDFNLFGPKVRYRSIKYLPFFKLKKTRHKKSDGLIFDASAPQPAAAALAESL